MSTEENKALVLRFYEALNKQNLAAILEHHAPDFVWHDAALGISPDRAGVKQFCIALWAAFPDAHYTVEDLIAEGDKVVSRFTVRGTHRGDFTGIPPTGKVVTMTGIAIYRLAGGRRVEEWVNVDLLGLMQQLGAILQMAQTGA
jgi:steroid delta-isomerase-like uncharacterized protein